MEKNENIIPLNAYRFHYGDNYSSAYIKAESVEQAVEIFATTQLEPYKYVGRNSTHILKNLSPTGFMPDGTPDPKYKCVPSCSDLPDYQVVQVYDENLQNLLMEIPVFELYKYDMWDSRNHNAQNRLMLMGDVETASEGLVSFDSIAKYVNSSSMAISSKKVELVRQMRNIENQLHRLQNDSRQLDRIIEERAEKLHLMHLYLGVNNQIKQIRVGKNAPDDVKIHIFESLKFMNEEVGVLEDFSDIDFSDIEMFDNWVAEHYMELLPLPKCIQIMRVRRESSKRYSFDPYNPFSDPNAPNFKYYFLFRNGSNVFRLFGNIDIPGGIFPSDNFYSDFYGFSKDFKLALLDIGRQIINSLIGLQVADTKSLIEWSRREQKLSLIHNDTIIDGNLCVVTDEIVRNYLINDILNEDEKLIDFSIKKQSKNYSFEIIDSSYSKIIFQLIPIIGISVDYRFTENNYGHSYERSRSANISFKGGLSFTEAQDVLKEQFTEEVSGLLTINRDSLLVTIDPGALLHLDPLGWANSEEQKIRAYRENWALNNNVKIDCNDYRWHVPTENYYLNAYLNVLVIKEQVKSHRICCNAINTPKAESVFAVQTAFLAKLSSSDILQRIFEKRYILISELDEYLSSGWLRGSFFANDYNSPLRNTLEAFTHSVMYFQHASIDEYKQDVLNEKFDEVMARVKKDQYKSFKALLVFQNVLDYTRIFGSMAGKVNLFIQDERFEQYILRLREGTLALADSVAGRIPFEVYIKELMERPLKRGEKVFIIDHEKTDLWHIMNYKLPTDDSEGLHTNTGAVYMVKNSPRSGKIYGVTGDFGTKFSYSSYKNVPLGRTRKYERASLIPFDCVQDLDRIKDYIALRSFRDAYFSTWYSVFVSIIRYVKKHDGVFDFSWFEGQGIATNKRKRV